MPATAARSSSIRYTTFTVPGSAVTEKQRETRLWDRYVAWYGNWLGEFAPSLTTSRALKPSTAAARRHLSESDVAVMDRTLFASSVLVHEGERI